MVEPIPNGRKSYNKVTSQAKPLKNKFPPNIFREPCRNLFHNIRILAAAPQHIINVSDCIK
ncbi:Uncharacterised protein [Vibrio cholerae]|nr:Uncharacterised protein [Vibrio cholerae]